MIQKVLGSTLVRRVVEFFFQVVDFLSFSLSLPSKEQTMTTCLFHMVEMCQTVVTKGIKVSSYSGLVWKIRKMVWVTGS